VAAVSLKKRLTIFYADLLMRRSRRMTTRSTRITHLEMAMARYWNTTGHTRFSAEDISRVAYNAGPDALGDYSASVHLIGELLGAMLDLRIREASGGTGSMDDVMRKMNAQFGGKGFTSANIRTAAEEVCRCDTANLFETSVFHAGAIDFDHYLGTIGLRSRITREPSLDQNGSPLRDVRMFAYTRPGEDSLRLVITDPGNAWGRAGLHTNDVLLTLNGAQVGNWPALRAAMAGFALGDTVSLRIHRAGEDRVIAVPVVGYDHPVVHLESVPGASEAALRLRRLWEAGF